MAKTKTDVVAMAHRSMGILSADETPTADQEAYAGDVLDALLAEIAAIHGVYLSYDLDETFLPMSYLLAAEIAPHYGVQAMPRSMAMSRLLAYAVPDNRPDRRDLDENGTVTAAERAAAGRAEYY